ncbi:hypothetical protein BRY73_00950 [Ochrobactrum sp. P6BS-III]|nr:hypothetical protein BRY73_00950 [Ochrobactrum sp. P6BS-III]
MVGKECDDEEHPRSEHLDRGAPFIISPREIEYMRGRIINNSKLSHIEIINVPYAILPLIKGVKEDQTTIRALDMSVARPRIFISIGVGKLCQRESAERTRKI